MAKPRLVRPELTEDDLISELRNGPYKVSVLMEKYGKTRGEIRSAEKKWAPKDKIKLPSRAKLNHVPVELHTVKPPAPDTDKPEPVVGRSVSQIIWGIFAILIGMLLGVAGIILNCQYWYAVGGSNQAVSLIFCSMGGAVDGAAVAMPSWAVELWKKRNYVLSCVVLILFVPVALVSLIASAGFSGTNIGDNRQIRADAKTKKEDFKALLDMKKSERATIKATEMPAVIEILIQNERGRIPKFNLTSSNDCTDTTFSDKACSALKQLRSDKAKAERRIVLDAEIEKMTEKYETMPSIASKDPASERVSQMTAGFIRPETVLSYLINAMAAAPIMSGLCFTIATALLRRKKPRHPGMDTAASLRG